MVPFCCSGASSDFDGATKIAKMMVTRFGMSDKVCLTDGSESVKLLYTCPLLRLLINAEKQPHILYM